MFPILIHCESEYTMSYCVSHINVIFVDCLVPTNVISNHKLEHKQLTRNGERNNLAPFLLDCLCSCYWCCR